MICQCHLSPVLEFLEFTLKYWSCETSVSEWILEFRLYFCVEPFKERERERDDKKCCWLSYNANVVLSTALVPVCLSHHHFALNVIPFLMHNCMIVLTIDNMNFDSMRSIIAESRFQMQKPKANEECCGNLVVDGPQSIQFEM